ncbi:hypothetical protein ACS6L2_11890 [Aquirufa ecclesiirivi]
MNSIPETTLVPNQGNIISADDLLDYFENYLIGDLKNIILMADSKPETDDFSSFNRIAVPTAITIFSALDILGLFIRIEDSTKLNLKEIGATTENIREAMMKWDCFGLNEYADETRESSQSRDEFLDIFFKCFVEVYRHGMSHSFFQKKSSISNNKSNEDLKLFWFDNNGELVFNVRKFYLCFLGFFGSLRNEIKSNEVFKNSFESVLNGYYCNSTKCDFQSFVEKLKSYYGNSLNSNLDVKLNLTASMSNTNPQTTQAPGSII